MDSGSGGAMGPEVDALITNLIQTSRAPLQIVLFG
jgi:hypothetical protein